MKIAGIFSVNLFPYANVVLKRVTKSKMFIAHIFMIFVGYFSLFFSSSISNAYSQGDHEDTNPCSKDEMKKILKKICHKESFEGNCFDTVYKKIDEMTGQDLMDGIRVMYYVCEKQ